MTTELTGPAYRIITNRLVIRCYNPVDAPLMVASVTENIEHLRPWMAWIADEPETLEQKIDRIRKFRGNFDHGLDYIYGIFDLQETRLLGGTGLHTRIGPRAREIGYWIHKDYIGQGLATESSAALIRVAFEIDKVNRVEIHCAPENVASSAVPRKLGFTHEATLKKRTPFGDGELRDSMIWTLFAADYPASPASRASIQAFDAIDRRLI
jgi:RimJ/RimL family protein N-acetyltransferase